MDSLALEATISSAESSLDALGWALIGVTLLIAVGLAIECWPDWQKVDRRQPNPDLWMELGGAALITVAIVAEFVIQLKAFSAETTLRTSNHAYVAGLQLRAEQLKHENLQLQKLMMARRLINFVNVPEWISEADKKFSGIRTGNGYLKEGMPIPPSVRPLTAVDIYIQTVPDFESEVLQNDLEKILKYEGWSFTELSGGQTGIPPLSIQRGVVVMWFGGQLPRYFRNEDLIAGGEALCAALSRAGLTDQNGEPIQLQSRQADMGIPGVPPLPYFTPPLPMGGILIEIGIKPGLPPP